MSELRSEDLALNKLDLVVSDDVSVVAERSLVQSHFSKTSWTENENLRVNLSASSANFVDGRTSYLSFLLTNTSKLADGITATSARFGVGSALNLFRDAWGVPASGQELDRATNIGLYHASTQPYKYPLDYFKGPATLYGASIDDDTSSQVSSNWGKATVSGLAAGESVWVSIPLCKLLPCFDQHKLLPPTIVSNLELNWSMVPAVSALITPNANDLPGYTINNPVIYLDTYRMSDATTNVMMQVAAKEGLKNEWVGWRHTSKQDSGTSVVMTSQQQLSSARRVIVKSRETANVSAADVDSMASTTMTDNTSGNPTAGFSGYSMQIGQKTFPSAPVRGNTSLICRNAVNAFYDQDCRKPCAVSIDTRGGTKLFNVGFGLVAVDLMRNQNLYQSGLAIVNGQSIVAQLDIATGVASTYDMFIEHNVIAVSNPAGVHTYL